MEYHRNAERAWSSLIPTLKDIITESSGSNPFDRNHITNMVYGAAESVSSGFMQAASTYFPGDAPPPPPPYNNAGGSNFHEDEDDVMGV